MWGEDRREAERALANFWKRNLLIPVETPFEDYGARWRLHDHLGAVAAARLAAAPGAAAARDGWLNAALEMMETAGDLLPGHGDGIDAGLALLDLDLPTIRRAADGRRRPRGGGRPVGAGRHAPAELRRS